MKKCPQCGLSIEDDVYQCGYCQSDLTKDKKSQSFPNQSELRLQQKAGVKRVHSGSYVYVLTNSAMPGLVKIGYTDIDPYTRASQLSNTNVPTPFKVYGYVEVNYPKEVEKAVHKKLAKYRKHRSREFFRIQPEKAVEVLENISGHEELKRQQEATKAAKLKREREAHYLLKYQQEDAEAAKLKREKEARNKQEQLEQEVFEILNIIIEEKLEIANKFNLYKKLKKYPGYLAVIILIIGIVSLENLEFEATAIFFIGGAIVGIIYYILYKMMKKKFESFVTNVCKDMETFFGQSWHPFKETCLLLIYNKMDLGDWPMEKIRKWSHQTLR